MHFDIAFGSAREVTYLIGLAQRLDLVDRERAAQVEELGRRAAACLAALIASRRPLGPKALGPKPLGP